MKSLRNRLVNLVRKETKKLPGDTGINSSSKKIFVYDGEKLVGEYDSITKCSLALGMSRPAVKKVIEFGTLLDNGLKLTFNKQ